MQCLECHAPIPGTGKDRKYCCRECAKAAVRRRWREANPKTPLAIIETGAIAELNQQRVIAHLLEGGFMVYRALYHGMPYSIIAVSKTGVQWRIEVVPGSYSTSGKLTYPKRDTSKFDILFAVTTEQIHYIWGERLE